MSKDIKKIYLNRTVYEESLNRVRWLFDEFENVMVGFSGGKDSTVCFNLALKVAEEKNRLPLTVVFLDQEAEYQNVIDYVEQIMTDERVNPFWIQAPFKINNATSFENPWLYCWKEGEKWIREKHKLSHKTNDFGVDTFHKLFTGIVNYLSPDKTACYISGVRSEESPARHMAMTCDETYKGVTWGKKLNVKKGHYTFYPIYDWSYLDVWKSISSNKWDYCKIYDLQYQYGVPLNNMRVSNLHHETALHSLFFLQEVEPETWEKLVSRLEGINTTTKLGREQYKMPKKLPYMFESWVEYRDYLVDKLITNEEYNKKFKNEFANMDRKYANIMFKTDMHKTQVTSILTNDFEFTKTGNWKKNPAVGNFIKFDQLGVVNEFMIGNKYINQELLKERLNEKRG